MDQNLRYSDKTYLISDRRKKLFPVCVCPDLVLSYMESVTSPMVFGNRKRSRLSPFVAIVSPISDTVYCITSLNLVCFLSLALWIKQLTTHPKRPSSDPTNISHIFHYKFGYGILRKILIG